MRCLAIDPGNKKSAYVVVSFEGRDPLSWEIEAHAKIDNEDLLDLLSEFALDFSVIEMISSYGFKVGDEVFETCRWIGRFEQELSSFGRPPFVVKRIDVKIHVSGSVTANDSAIRSIMHRIWPDSGLANDEWQAAAVAVCAIEQTIYGCKRFDLSKVFHRKPVASLYQTHEDKKSKRGVYRSKLVVQ
jgi:hypothetical protein